MSENFVVLMGSMNGYTLLQMHNAQAIGRSWKTNKGLDWLVLGGRSLENKILQKCVHEVTNVRTTVLLVLNSL